MVITPRIMLIKYIDNENLGILGIPAYSWSATYSTTTNITTSHWTIRQCILRPTLSTARLHALSRSA